MSEAGHDGGYFVEPTIFDGVELRPYGIDHVAEMKQIYTDGTGLTTKPPYRQVLRG